MSGTSLEVFDKTLQETNIWLKEIMEEIGPDRQRAYHAMRAVLHALRDRLTVDQTAHLSAQLPMLIRGVFFEGWHPAGTPTKERTQEDFLEHVGAGLQGIEPINPQVATRAVFGTIGRHVTPGQVEHIQDALPKAVRSLWP